MLPYIRNKRKDCMGRNQANVSEWCDMFTLPSGHYISFVSIKILEGIEIDS